LRFNNRPDKPGFRRIRTVKKTLLRCLITVLLLSVVQTAGAKDTVPAGGAADAVPQPVVVISLSGYERVMNDIGFIGQIAQFPGLDKQADAMITLVTQGKGLNGLDKKRPWGVVLNIGSAGPQPIGFLPVSDLKQLLDSLAQHVGPASDAGSGILQIEKPNQRWYLKEQKGWVFISPMIDNLAKVPADPTQWLAGLDKQYEVAVKVYIHNIPKMFRDMAVDYIKQLNQTLPSPDDEDEATKEKRRQLLDNQAKSFEEMINTIDQFTLGWAIDQSADTSHLDVTLTALPDSNLAKKLNAQKDTTSSYTGFMVPKGAVVLNSSQTLLVDDIQQAAQGIDTFQASVTNEIENSPDITDDDSRAAAKRIVAEASQAIKATIQSGKIDFGGSWLVGDRQFTILFGAYIKEPDELEKAFEDLVKVVSKDPNFPGTKFDLVTDGDVRFHTWTSPVPADDKVNRAIGKELKVAVGFGQQSVYVGVSTDDPLPGLKKAIADSKAGGSKKVSPGVVDVSLKPILEFASVLNPDDDTTAAVLAEVAKIPGKDHIHLQVRPLTDGVSYRLELQEGVLRALGLTAKLQMMKQQGR
jgi:hypothetical protein